VLVVRVRCRGRYDKAANHLAKLFVKNFEEFKKGAKVDYSVHGPAPQ
jgi:ATP-dependent phosphoenolpyruvate carboxykinase